MTGGVRERNLIKLILCFNGNDITVANGFTIGERNKKYTNIFSFFMQCCSRVRIIMPVNYKTGYLVILWQMVFHIFTFFSLRDFQTLAVLRAYL